jgi:non-homologous end joining protein Ku
LQYFPKLSLRYSHYQERMARLRVQEMKLVEEVLAWDIEVEKEKEFFEEFERNTRFKERDQGTVDA